MTTPAPTSHVLSSKEFYEFAARLTDYKVINPDDNGFLTATGTDPSDGKTVHLFQASRGGLVVLCGTERYRGERHNAATQAWLNSLLAESEAKLAAIDPTNAKACNSMRREIRVLKRALRNNKIAGDALKSIRLPPE